MMLTGSFLEVLARSLGWGEKHPTGYAPVKNRLGVGPKNARGYRDDERAIPKPAGVRRVLSVGDSFAWGLGVEYSDAYPQRLERSLTRRRHERWEVVNLAVPGINSVQEADQLVREGFAYQPDVVVLGYVLNDSEESNAANLRRVVEWEAHEARRVHQSSALLRFIDGRLFATTETWRRVNAYQAMYADGAPGWLAAQDALRTMGRLCRERGVPFVVAIFPLFGNPLDERYPFENIHRKVDQAVRAAGGYPVDLLPEYRGLRWDLLVVNGERDEHPNEIAHRIAAEALLPRLNEVLGPPPAR
jgi:GDSL-like Lipase/Acylhydrolase family